jgi:hypothetical protein
MKNTLKLGAVPFDMGWAQGEAKHCRIRFRRRGIYSLEIEDDEIVSLLCELWATVAAGEMGNFQPNSAQPVDKQLQAYVVGCLDNEVMRYIRNEGSRSLFSMARGQAHPLRIEIDECFADASEDDAADSRDPGLTRNFDLPWEDRDPLQILLERENNAGIAAGGHPAQIGGLLASWIEHAYSMDLRRAQAIRARRRPSDGVTLAMTRVNLAWAVVMTAADYDAKQIRRLAPLLCIRWIDQDPRPTRKLIPILYPGLKSHTPTEAISGREARNALRFLAIRGECGSSVGPEHLRRITEDACDAMINWVGVRAPYRQKAKMDDKAEDDYKNWDATQGDEYPQAQKTNIA